ncbi:hypothetical protein BO71DRAFT_461601 [Aspergillus ellipticus CBS 707.79]|uniref:Uncharacterized protein n=1 Tax=Aspergillus ellipticus CBS 707.79 TaxID=1448320 RepID=A0A319D8D7_9EURO|nr:hypothetical protein BO71DRAFT_461601 [Aspergillus ellipticus CBS 707.79]
MSSNQLDDTVIHFVINLRSQKVRLYTQIHPLRAELELQSFSRDYFVWLSHQPHVQSISLLLFIDDFGAYRNMYKALKGFYLTPSALSYRERRRPANSFTLTLGPHGADFHDVIASFKSDLESTVKGFYSCLNSSSTIIIPSIIVLTGDMPQQAKNSGVLSYSANLGCRTCYYPQHKRHLSNYDMIFHGRYHLQMQAFREQGACYIISKEQKQYFIIKGIQPYRSPVETFIPTLDLVLGRPYDIPHSD